MSLGDLYKVQLSETNLAELVATKDAGRRKALIDHCQHLVFHGECMQPYHWILKELSVHHAADSAGFEWERLSIRFPELEEEIVRKEFLESEDFSTDVRATNRSANEEFARAYGVVRAQFEAAYKKVGPVTLETVFETLAQPSSPLMKLAIDVYRTQTGVELDEPEIRRFIDRCPPFNAILMSMCVGQYNWGIRPRTEEAIYKAGRLDLFMAVYLPYCEWFITEDEGQFNAFRIVAERARLPVQITTYESFKKNQLMCV